VEVIAHLTRRYNDAMSVVHIEGMEGLGYYSGIGRVVITIETVSANWLLCD
jgi:hypothetical protein